MAYYYSDNDDDYDGYEYYDHDDYDARYDDDGETSINQYIYYSKWAINVTVIPPSAV